MSFLRRNNKLVSENKKKNDKRDDSKAKRKKPVDEDITSESDRDSDDNLKVSNEASSEDENETTDQKRFRLAHEHLKKLDELEAAKTEDTDEDAVDPIAQRLQHEILEKRGKLHKDIAKQYVAPTLSDVTVCKGHQLAVTCVIVTPDNNHIYSASKDCSIIKWSVCSGKKVHVIHGVRKGADRKHTGHADHILSLAISSDTKFLASGDRSSFIYIWSPESHQHLHTFTATHKANPVIGLAFSPGSHQLYSAAYRHVKIWNLDEMAYVAIAEGHEDVITCIDALPPDRAVTSGGRDRRVHIVKVIDESYLMFTGHTGSVDCVCFVDENHFLSGADDNSLCLWSVLKKSPLVTVNHAHAGCSTLPGYQSESAGNHLDDVVPGVVSDEISMMSDNWLMSVAALHYSDLVVSAGSKDGFIRFWQCGQSFQSLTRLFALPMNGFVNSLQFSSDGEFLVAGVGQEHRLGRWWHLKSAKNSVCIIRLSKTATVAMTGVDSVERLLSEHPTKANNKNKPRTNKLFRKRKPKRMAK